MQSLKCEPLAAAGEADSTVPTSASCRKELDLNWASGVSEQDWKIFRLAMRMLRDAGIPFMLGGGFALASFTGRWRNTKDIDFYILPRHREQAVQLLTAGGFTDYYEKLPYDRVWIYRSTQADVIVDVIWAMANKRAQVDDLWVERAGRLTVRGEDLLILPVEEFLWCKLYILQRDRCDWIDVINVIYSHGAYIDWHHLLERLGPDKPLLKGLLTVYAWLHPERALQLPQSLRDELKLELPDVSDADCWLERSRFLDSRAWFSALKARGERLEI